MNCPICGAQLSENEKICPVCGYTVENALGVAHIDRCGGKICCPVCGMNLDETVSICPMCGTKLEITFSENVVVEEDVEQIKDTHGESSDEHIVDSPDKENAAQEKKTKPKRRIWIIILVCIIIAACILAVYFFFGSGGSETDISSTDESETIEADELNEEELEEEDEQSDAEEDIATGTAESDSGTVKQADSGNNVPNLSYIGYWNISGNEDVELTISDVTEDTVKFTLFSYRAFSIDDAMAYIDEDNVASFACADGGMMVTGDMTFYDDCIVLDIDRADMTYINTGIMVFDEKHLTSWYNSGNSAWYDSGTGSSYSYYSMDSYDSYYILPESSARLLTYDDIKYLSSDELRLARNEIYARHGRRFSDASLQEYFDSQPWYNGTIDPDDFDSGVLSSIEKTNISFIGSYE